MEVLGLERSRMNPCQDTRNGPAIRQLEIGEVFASCLISSFAQVQEVARPFLALELLQKLGRVFLGDVGDLTAGDRQRGIAGLFAVADQAPVVTNLPAGIVEPKALSCRRAPEQAFALDIPRDGGQEVGSACKHGQRSRHTLPVLGQGSPLVSVGERSRYAPQRKRVVHNVVVELDQTRKNGAARLDHLSRIEAGRRWLVALLNRYDGALRDV